jgi:hypothetical protein
MPKFFCESCKHEFETGSPVKKEYMDYILGPCSKNIAYCPVCGSESGEKLVPKPGKADKPKDYCDGNCSCCGA